MKLKDLLLVFFVAVFFLGCSDNSTNNEDNTLPSVKIGTQVWMKRNLDVSHYRNGEAIRHCQTDEEWVDADNKKEGAWCYYNNDPAMGAIYGKLYNFYAVADYRGLAPIGWHIPTDAEWAVLVANVGGQGEAGKLKEAGTEHWLSPNSGASNSIGFSGLPGGGRRGCWYDPNNNDNDSIIWAFEDLRWVGYWWFNTPGMGNEFNGVRYLRNSEMGIYRTIGSYFVGDGYSVRCVRD